MTAGTAAFHAVESGRYPSELFARARCLAALRGTVLNREIGPAIQLRRAAQVRTVDAHPLALSTLSPLRMTYGIRLPEAAAGP